MRYTTYRYNTETCHYERVRIGVKDVVWYVLGVSTTAACMLVGLLILHDVIVNTDNEKRLRSENKALREHHLALSRQLNELQPVLTSLQNKDRSLHVRFFGTSPVSQGSASDRASKEDILLANADTFRSLISSIRNSTEKLSARSHALNTYYGHKAKIGKDDLPLLESRPTLQPVLPWDSDRLISGFGMRVNPFHKGLYDHPGLDIAAPRGTPVVATAPGVVVQLKRSDLEAGYGNYIEIDHGNGFTTRYAHLEDIQVRYGAKVKKGDAVGTIGSSGGSVAPHLHYEILKDGKNVDPAHFMVEGLDSEEHYRLTLISQRQNQSLD